MAKIVRRSRKIMLGAAFVGVMGGAGALFGIVAGVLVALLGWTVLQLRSGVFEMVLLGAGIGLSVAMAYAFFLVAAQRPRLALTRRASSRRMATQPLPEANETVAA